MTKQSKISSLFYNLIVSVVIFLSFSSLSFSQIISVPYSGRLVQENGQPIEGQIDIVVEFYDNYAGGNLLSDPLIFQSTGLIDGVFQLDITLQSEDFHKIFSKVGKKVWIQITDSTNGSIYPRQEIATTAYALKVPVDEKTIGWNDQGQLELLESASTSKLGGQKVDVTGAKSGEVLAWDAPTKTWKPTSPGNITSVSTSDLNDSSPHSCIKYAIYS